MIFGRSIRCRQRRLALVSRDYPGMVCCKNFWRGIHALMLVEKRANILGKLPVVGLPGCVQRISGLFIGTAYLTPPECAGGDERRQLILAARDSDGLFVGAAVRVRNLAAPFGSQPRP